MRGKKLKIKWKNFYFNPLTSKIDFLAVATLILGFSNHNHPNITKICSLILSRTLYKVGLLKFSGNSSFMVWSWLKKTPFCRGTLRKFKFFSTYLCVALIAFSKKWVSINVHVHRVYMSVRAWKANVCVCAHYLMYIRHFWLSFWTGSAVKLITKMSFPKDCHPITWNLTISLWRTTIFGFKTGIFSKKCLHEIAFFF